MTNTNDNKELLNDLLRRDFTKDERQQILTHYTCNELLQTILEHDVLIGDYGNVLMKSVTKNPFYPFDNEEERNLNRDVDMGYQKNEKGVA
jgi:hypothetical protein